MTEQDISSLESAEWIAVYKPGLLTLVKELTEAHRKIIELEAELKKK